MAPEHDDIDYRDCDEVAKWIVGRAVVWTEQLQELARNQLITGQELRQAVDYLRSVKEPLSELASDDHNPYSEQDRRAIRQAIAALYSDTIDTPAYLRKLREGAFAEGIVAELNDDAIRGRMASAYLVAGGDSDEFWNKTFADVDGPVKQEAPEPQPARPQSSGFTLRPDDTEYVVTEREKEQPPKKVVSRRWLLVSGAAAAAGLAVVGPKVNEWMKDNTFNIEEEAIANKEGATILTDAQNEWVRNFETARTPQLRDAALSAIEGKKKEDKSAIIARIYMNALNAGGPSEAKGKEIAEYLVAKSDTLRSLQFTYHKVNVSNGKYRDAKKNYIELAEGGFVNDLVTPHVRIVKSHNEGPEKDWVNKLRDIGAAAAPGISGVN